MTWGQWLVSIGQGTAALAGLAIVWPRYAELLRLRAEVARLKTERRPTWATAEREEPTP